jgi:hypothetical protein
VFVTSKLFQTSVLKHSSLLDPFSLFSVDSYRTPFEMLVLDNALQGPML